MQVKNQVFNSNSITNKDLLESSLAPAIESGKLVVFHVEENTSTGNSTSVYFIQKTSSGEITDGLSIGIIGNTANRGNQDRYLRSVKSFGHTVSGKSQEVVCDVKAQTLALSINGSITNINLADFAIKQVRTTELPLDATGDVQSIGWSPIRNPNLGVLCIDGKPIFENIDVVTSKTGEPYLSDIKHNSIMSETEFKAHIENMGLSNQSVMRMTKGATVTTGTNAMANAKF